jgi:DNA mismatch endonuclease (patch repair protein)
MEEPASWASSPQVRASMQANRSKDTKPELALRRALHARGLRYFKNRRPIPAVRRTADIVFPTTRLAVFIYGCFWHGCPDHHTVAKANADYWSTKVQRNRARDVETDAMLAAAGWTSLRIWEHVSTTEAADLVQAAVANARAQKADAGEAQA